MSGRRLFAVAGATAVAAIVAVVVMAAVGVFDASDDGPANAQASAEENTIHRIDQREGRSVYFVQSSGPQGAGTGTARRLDAAGHLVTNEHVISGGITNAIQTDAAINPGGREHSVRVTLGAHRG